VDKSADNPKRRSLRLPGHDYREPGYAYFLTIRARADTRPFADQALAQEAIGILSTLEALSRVRVIAYCFMPDHLHLICWAADGADSIPSFVGRFKSFVTRAARSYGYGRSLWQRYYYDHVVRKSEDLKEICEYVIANPERKGLVGAGEGYPFAAFLGLP